MLGRSRLRWPTRWLSRQEPRSEANEKPGRKKPGKKWATAGVVAAVVAIATAGLVQLRISTNIDSFLPSGDPTVRALQDHARAFGGDPIVVLLESAAPGALLSKEALPRMVGLEGQLAQLPGVSVVYGPGTVLNQVASQAQDLLARISGRRDVLRTMAEQRAHAAGDPPDKVAAEVNQATSQFDLRYGSLLVQGLPSGLPTLRNPGFVRTVLFDTSGQPRPQWHFVLPSPNAVSVLVRPDDTLDQDKTEQLVDAVRATAQRSGLPAARVTVSGVPTVTAQLGRQVRSEIPLLASVALLVVAGCLWVSRAVSSRRRRLVPLLIAVAVTGLILSLAGWAHLPLSLGAVTFLPILFGIASYYPLYLTQPVQRQRVVVAAIASAASFASLGLSSLPFVRELGLALASGILLAVGLSLLTLRFLPGAMGSPAEASQGAGDSDTGLPRPVRSRRRRLGTLVVLAAVSVTGWVALPHIGVAADPQRLAAGLSAMGDARHAEQVLGSSGEMSIMLEGHDVLTPGALQWVRTAQDNVTSRYGDSLQQGVSLSDLLRFLGDHPSPEEISAAVHLVPSYLTGSVLSGDEQRTLLTYGMRLQDLRTQASVLREVRSALPRPPPGYHAELAGLPVVAARAYELVSGGRLLGNTAGIVAAALVLLLGLRGRGDALRAVLAAVLATGWGLALVWITGQELSPLTIALGSLTTAVGCEFTVLLTHAQRRGEPRLRRSVGIAAVTSAAGFAVLGLSTLALIRQFGLLLACSVGLSYLAAALVVRLLPNRRELPGSAGSFEPRGRRVGAAA